MKNNRVILVLMLATCSLFLGCYRHPFYKKLTRGNWEKDTVWIKFTDLPKPILDTIDAFFKAKFTIDTTDDISDMISFDPQKQFVDVDYFDFDSSKLRFPFGWYFKLGERKYFIDYSELKGPYVFYKDALYFRSGQYFDKTIKDKIYSTNDHLPYDKQYYIKYTRKKW